MGFYGVRYDSKLLSHKEDVYGVEWDEANPSPVLTRVGNPFLHTILPVQSEMVRVLLSDSGVETPLNPSDSTKKLDGTAADLSGAAGQFMVRVPEFWYKTVEDGTYRQLLISKSAQPGWEHSKRSYISVDCATVHRPTNTLSSVVNESADYRGGNNNAAWDADAFKKLLGKPATQISRTNFRTYARNRGTGWEMLAYHVYNAIRILYYTEYANLNSQLAYNAALTAEGYKQGGLGNGVTNVNSANWNTWNSYYPLIPCGYTADLGNNSGVKDYTIDNFEGRAITVSVPSYRGFANPFGHLWQNADGCLYRIEAEGKSEFFATSDRLKFTDTDVSLLDLRGEVPRTEGYIRKVLYGSHADFVASEVGGGSTTYYCDYFYASNPSTGVALRTLSLGGNAATGATGAYAGLAVATSRSSPAITYASVGSRLCFLT